MHLSVVSTNCSIREYQCIFHGIKLHRLKHPPNMLALCWYDTTAYYAMLIAGTFDTGLIISIS